MQSWCPWALGASQEASPGLVRPQKFVAGLCGHPVPCGGGSWECKEVPG